MCGITGFTGPSNPKILKKMTRTLVHRGPDDEAFYEDEFCSLGIRRLAIIDLTSGIYPLTNETQTIFCIFNGEIYNFQEIRREQAKLGHRFKTNCDGEVIVHGFEEWGEKVLDKLNGMFAICVYDKRQRKVFLARDRLGQKPLYWTKLNSQLIFGSELKAILAHPAVRKDLDFNSLNKYLSYEYVPAPHTIFKNIYKLEPGHYLTFRNGEVTIKQYWDITFKSQISNLKSQNHNLKLKTKPIENELIGQLDQELNQAVKLRLISDVALGIFLSGGIDSSTIAYYAAKQSSQKIRTFSIGFEEKDYDESSYARQVAAYLHTDHHEQILSSQKMLDLIPKLFEFMDEPFADPSLPPSFLLSKFTRQTVTVALGGDGCDEFFLGYVPYQGHKLAQIYQLVPRIIREKLIAPIAHQLPTSFSDYSFDYKTKRFTQTLDYPAEIRNQLWLSAFLPDEKVKIFSSSVQEKISFGQTLEEIERYLRVVKNEELQNRLSYLFAKTYLTDFVLTKVDRASMANSLEVRAPFLDFNLVNFITGLPINKRLHFWTTKYLLKKLMQNHLPYEIVYRKKKGFGIPLAKWLTTDLKDLMLDLLSKENIEKDGFFNYRYVEKLMTDHLNHHCDNHKQLWALMCFQLWQERWLK